MAVYSIWYHIPYTEEAESHILPIVLHHLCRGEMAMYSTVVLHPLCRGEMTMYSPWYYIPSAEER
jgi:hypothetical protein